jgi:glycosyltransferase involved in cell wall biosynthesis
MTDAQQVYASSAAARFHRWAETRLIRRHEAAVIENSDLVVALTEEDAAQMHQLYSPAAIAVVPNGVRMHNVAPGRPGQPTVGFLGSYSWQPNVDAVKWFVSEIWPQVRASVPDATFSLIGNNLDVGAMAGVADPGVRRVGYVPDLGRALGSIAVGVVPMRTGTGIRCKLLDFLAGGVPIVTTQLGLRGVPARHGVECLVADAPDEFAHHVVTLLRDRQTRARMSGAARQLAESLKWASRAAEMQVHLQRVARHGSVAR